MQLKLAVHQQIFVFMIMSHVTLNFYGMSLYPREVAQLVRFSPYMSGVGHHGYEILFHQHSVATDGSASSSCARSAMLVTRASSHSLYDLVQ